jgi:DNA-binding NtrC family response regulator
MSNQDVRIAVYGGPTEVPELETALGRQGWRLDRFTRGAELLDALKNPRVEVVLVVLSKGHPERLAFLQSKDLTTQLPPVVVLTDCFDVDLYVEALRRGAYDGVGIPLDHKELLRVIRAAVTEERSRRRELAATA